MSPWGWRSAGSESETLRAPPGSRMQMCPRLRSPTAPEALHEPHGSDERAEGKRHEVDVDPTRSSQAVV